MDRMSTVKKSMITAVCIALCVVLPMAFHSIENAGSIFCPIHIPVLLCGLVTGWPFGLLCGLAGPLVSSLVTGMPPMAYLPSMMLELASYGLVAGAISKLLRTGKIYIDMYIALLCAMILGRIVAGASRALIFAPGTYSMAAWISSYFVICMPGLVLQILLIPSVVLALEKSGLVPARYKKQIKSSIREC